MKLPALLLAVGLTAPAPDTAVVCDLCARWNQPHAPLHVFGNTWWVGVDGLGVVAIDTGAGIILLDGALPQSAPLVKASLAAAGLRLADVKLIGNSHAHFDHAGGIAVLQRESGAKVMASARSAEVLRTGCPTPDDPQAAFGCPKYGFPPVREPILPIRDGEVIKLGGVELTAHLTPGHTPGSTTWTWRSCEGARCLNIVYADSLNPVSGEGFRFEPIAGTFKASIATVAALPCDVLLTPHPDASDTLERLSSPDGGGRPDPAHAGQCAAYAAQARAKLEARLASEARLMKDPPR
jgi:metallo-beta-lactamase class B